MSEKGLLSKSIASNISEAIIDKLGGTGYTPTEWSKNINLLGIASADIEEALASITEDTSSSDKGLLSLSIASDMGAMLNKKYNTSRGFKPCEVSSAVSALTPLPEKTASSAPICVFNDGADDVPTKSLIVTIPPTFSGVSSVTETQTGKNLLDTANAETKSNNSVSVTCDGKGKYTATGTATGASANITFALKTPCTIKSGMYLHLMNSGAIGSVAITLQKQDNTTIYAPALSPANRIADLSSYAGQTIYSIRFYVANGTSFEMTLTPMLCYSNMATTFEPYTTPTTYTASLGRTIYGGTADIVNGVGRETSIMIDLAADIAASAWNMGATDRFRARLTQYQTASGWSGSWQNTVSNVFVCENPSTPFNNRSNYSFANIPQNYYNFDIKVPSGQFENTAEFTAWLANTDGNGKHAIIVIDRSTPETFTFDGQEINTRLGYNAFWSDSGDTEVTYRADLDLYEAPSTLLGSNNTETEGNEEQEENE